MPLEIPEPNEKHFGKKIFSSAKLPQLTSQVALTLQLNFSHKILQHSVRNGKKLLNAWRANKNNSNMTTKRASGE